MTTISQIPKPEADKFKDGRKLLLVPLYQLPYHTSTEGEKIIQKYWSQTTAHVETLQKQLGEITNVYHEGVFEKEQQAFNMIKSTNPKGEFLIKQLIGRSAAIQITEDQNLVLENSDWQRCFMAGLVSEKVSTAVIEGYQNSLDSRYQFISEQIDKTLAENQIGILFINENHKIQFPQDIHIFFVAPPGLDELIKWRDKIMSEQQAPIRNSTSEGDSEEEPIIMG